MKKSYAILIAVFLVAACGYDAWAAHQAEIKAMQDEGVGRLRASISLDDYREAEQKQINDILTASEDKIRSTEEQEEIDKIIDKAAEDFSKLKTDAQYTAEEEEAARQAELERQRREAEEAAAAAAAAAQQSKKKKKSSGSSGCVGGGSDNFY